MPKITKIARQQKNADRFSIFLDDKYSFSLNTEQLLEVRLSNDQELTQIQIKKYKKLSLDGKIKDSVLRKLLRRQHSQKEIVQFMQSKKAEQELIDQTIAELTQKGYLDDHKFAETWVRDRRSLKQRSNSMLRAELLQKGVEGSIIDEILSDSQTEQTEALLQLVKKKSTMTRYQDEQKLIAYLQRKGFRYSDIREALNSLED